MENVNKIADVRTDYSDRPMKEQKIKAMTVETFGGNIQNQRNVNKRRIMTEIRYVSIDGISYPVVLSDETEALLKAKADGKASVGFWDRNEWGQQDLSGASYLVEDLEDADQKFLEQVVRRHLGLPWKIAETRRLLIREFAEEDAGSGSKRGGRWISR